MLAIEIGARSNRVAQVEGFLAGLTRVPAPKRPRVSSMAATSKASGSSRHSAPVFKPPPGEPPAPPTRVVEPPAPPTRRPPTPVKEEDAEVDDTYQLRVPLDKVDQFRHLVNAIPKDADLPGYMMVWVTCANEVNPQTVQYVPKRRLNHTAIVDFVKPGARTTNTTVFFSNLPKTKYECLIGLPIMTIRGELKVGHNGVVAVNFGRHGEERETCSGQMWVKFSCHELAQFAIELMNGWYWGKTRGKEAFYVKAELSTSSIKGTYNRHEVQSSRYNEDVWQFVPGF
jgi:hypothetical protein